MCETCMMESSGEQQQHRAQITTVKAPFHATFRTCLYFVIGQRFCVVRVCVHDTYSAASAEREEYAY